MTARMTSCMTMHGSSLVVIEWARSKWRRHPGAMPACSDVPCSVQL